LNHGGIETWLRHLALANPPDSGVAMDFAAASLHDTAIRRDLLAAGCRIHYCPRQSRPLELAWNLHRILRTHGPYDVVHLHLHSANAAAVWAARIAGVPVRILHSHLDSTFEDERGSWAVQMGRGITRQASVAGATGGLAASLGAGDSLFGPSWIQPPAWRVLHCGIDLEPFTAPVNREAFRAGLGLPPNAFVIGHAGRFTPQKNHEYLIEIARATTQQNPRARFVLAGDGPLQERIAHRVKEERLGDRVLLLGTRADVPQLMLGAFDAFVLPSRFEGLPLVIMEAQAAGLPCVISDAVSEEADLLPTIQRLSVNASPVEWAAAIHRARDLRWEPRHAARLLRESDFDIQASWAEVSAYWRRSLDDHAPERNPAWRPPREVTP
jgi:glycosyltransferase involved in cell wall biosynthesis